MQIEMNRNVITRPACAGAVIGGNVSAVPFAAFCTALVRTGAIVPQTAEP